MLERSAETEEYFAETLALHRRPGAPFGFAATELHSGGCRGAGERRVDDAWTEPRPLPPITGTR